MDDSFKKVFLLKIPKETFEQLKKNPEPGYLEILLNKKRNNDNKKKIPECHLKLNDNIKGIHDFLINAKETDDFFYFVDKDKKDEMKLRNINYFGNIVVQDDEEGNQLVKNVFTRETTKSNKIEIKNTDNQKKYKELHDISLSNRKGVSRGQKEKRVRMDKPLLIEKIKKLMRENDDITVKEMNEILQQPDNYFKEVINEICDNIDDGTKKGTYKLKEEYE